MKGASGGCLLSEHDFKDLWDGQDGVASCKSFHPLNRVQEDGQGERGRSRKGCFFAALRVKKFHALLSEHDYKDLKDLQDYATSCPSFNLLNRVQKDGQGERCRSRKGRFSLRLCEKNNTTPFCLNTIIRI